MRYFLSDELLGGFAKSDQQTGEQRGGKYAARVQIGIEKDGSPKYRYFESNEEYQEYLEGSGKASKKDSKNKDAKQLEDKVRGEQKQSKKKQERSESHKQGEERSKRSMLLGGKTEDDKKKKDDDKAEKSLRLYLGVFK